MSSGIHTLILVIAGFVMASLPFFLPRSLRTLRMTPVKAFLAFAAPSLLLFVIVIAIAMLFERRTGQHMSQSWEFYAVLACLWVIAAFPGFLWRYLRRPLTRLEIKEYE